MYINSENTMNIFLDTADLSEIARGYDTNLIDGVTTNPSLIRKSGKNPVDVIREMSYLFPKLKSISAEVVADSWEEMVEQAQDFKDLSNVTIKVPCTVEGLKACYHLSKDLIPVNVTLVFSVSQAILAAKAGASYVSPFVGRLNDNSFSGVALVQAISDTYSVQNVHTKVLAASLRDVHHVGRCFAAGANICTLPPKVFWKMYDHILTEKGLEIFQKDWEEASK
jgi:transaldolase